MTDHTEQAQLELFPPSSKADGLDHFSLHIEKQIDTLPRDQQIKLIKGLANRRGYFLTTQLVKCKKCHGLGEWVAPISRYGLPSRCPDCHGSGSVHADIPDADKTPAAEKSNPAV